MGTEAYLLEKAEKVGVEKGLKKGIEQGREEGLEQGASNTKTEIATNLILSTDFSDAKIAALAVVTEAYVQNLRAELSEEE